MGNPKILAVGHNSFLAGRFAAGTQMRASCTFVPHQEGLEPDRVMDADCVVNFALNPDLKSGPYDRSLDFDIRLAELVKASEAHYVMLSTRAVYAPKVAFGAHEGTPAAGANPYGANKAATERGLRDLLGRKLTVLRLGNIIGNEFGTGRRTFMGIALQSLKRDGRIVLDIDPGVRRDFLPDNRFVEVLDAVIRAPWPGPLNVGSGLPLAVGDVAGWLIEGYGSGEVEVNDHRVHDEFVLDVSLLREHYGLRIDREEIRRHCLGIGASLRDA